jgi:hypothetical protein
MRFVLALRKMPAATGIPVATGILAIASYFT